MNFRFTKFKSLRCDFSHTNLIKGVKYLHKIFMANKEEEKMFIH